MLFNVINNDVNSNYFQQSLYVSFTKGMHFTGKLCTVFPNVRQNDEHLVVKRKLIDLPEAQTVTVTAIFLTFLMTKNPLTKKMSYQR